MKSLYNKIPYIDINTNMAHLAVNVYSGVHVCTVNTLSHVSIAVFVCVRIGHIKESLH